MDSSTKISRKGRRRNSMIGETATCPCGVDYVVGEENEHFVKAARRTNATDIGFCPMIYGLAGAARFACEKGYRYVLLPGEDTPVHRISVWPV